MAPPAMGAPRHLFAALAAAALTTASVSPVFYSAPRHGTMQGLSVRQSSNKDQCPSGSKVCDIFCIESTYECCDRGHGEACDPGYYCIEQGCCRNGSQCSGPPRGCTEDAVLCDDICIPAGGVCCNTGSGSWCEKGDVCLSSGKCGRTSSGGDGGSDDSPDPLADTTVTVTATPTETTTVRRGGNPLPKTSAPIEVDGGTGGGGQGYSLAPVNSNKAGEDSETQTGESQAEPTGGAGDKSNSNSQSESDESNKGDDTGAGVAVTVPVNAMVCVLAAMVFTV